MPTVKEGNIYNKKQRRALDSVMRITKDTGVS